jgi:DtxR family transcriptional regulator, Mn-dependent transcriptional regulator
LITREREDYLKTIYKLQQDETPVRTTLLAKALGVEPASVTGVVKRLAELNYVAHQPYRGVALTRAGELIALEVIRRHRLIELYLIDALGYSWDEVHAEAERLEHAVSPLFIQRIEAALGYPEIDPHGSPIPTTDGQIAPRRGTRLSELGVGQQGHVARVSDDDPGLLRYLAGLSIRPGAEIDITSIEPYGGPIGVRVNGTPYSIGPQAAAQIFIELPAAG